MTSKWKNIEFKPVVSKTYLLALLVAVSLSVPTFGEPTFSHQVIDASNPGNPHCKTLGDIDGDGLIDAVAASSNGDGMVWYEFPSWTKHTIRAAGFWTTDMQVGDIDDDGDLDIVIPDGTALKWYENPRPGGDPRTAAWIERTIGTAGKNNHDVEVADMEPDGDLDVVSRKKGGGGTYFWRQGASPTSWTQVTVSTQSGEGVGLGDLDHDGDLDIAQNGKWVEQVSPTSWTEHSIDSNWPGDVGVLVADIDNNGTQDVVLAPSESSGRLSWYEAISPKSGPWIEHLVDATVSFLHTFKAADVDHDGDLDLVTAEMHQSSNPDEVSVYFNIDGGVGWKQQVVAESGSHNVRVGDFGGDGDLDIFGANWNDSAPNSAVIEMWENQTAPLALDQWDRHIVETTLPWQAVFVDGRDLNGDSLPDLVIGGWWYPNPGALAATWTRQTIGSPLSNMAAVHDFDRDGDLDVLGTIGQVSGEDLWWAENDGFGAFTVRDITNTATGGDFLQGVDVFQVISGGQEEIVLSWHNGGSGPGSGTGLLKIPNDPTTSMWPFSVASATTNQEQSPVGDIDGDGDADIHLGTSWLRQEAGGTFSVQAGVTLASGVPDRVQLVDLDRDGDLDVVIGVEFSNDLVWGENIGGGGSWVRHPIATDFDYFSVDTADLDNDGDLDVVGGAHQGSGEVSIYENDGSGTSWTTHIVDSGDSTQIDHHDGTVVIDMDVDGDLDIVSLGWTKRSLVIYENLSIDDGGGGGGDNQRPFLVSVSALGSTTQVIVDFNEALAEGSAENPANYSISGGVSVAAAVLMDNQRTVVLTTSSLTVGIAYVLTVNNVSDLAANSIAANSMLGFELGVGDPTSGLVAYWPFDEGFGGVALDVSGNGHHGFLLEGAQWTADSALLFDGVNDHVAAGSFDVGGSALTLSAWLWPEDLANCSARDCRIISKSTGTAEGDHTFMLSTIASGAETRLRFRLKTGGVTNTLIATSGDLAENQWSHAAAVYDGSKMELFLNGQLVGSMAKAGTITPASSVPVWIGGNPGGATEKPWKGKIDEVRVYGRSLAQTELQMLPPPSANWIFADGFESGNLARWSKNVGSIEVLSGAAQIGTRGVRLKAGTDCTEVDVIAITPPPQTVSGSFEACREVSVGAVQVVAPGATISAGEQIEVANGFSASADVALVVDPQLTPFAWLRSNSPVDEAAYTADYYLSLDGLALGSTDHLEHFVAVGGGQSSFKMVLQSDGVGGEEAFLEATLNDGSVVVTASGQEASISPGWHHLRFIWTTGAGIGRLALLVDGVEVVALTNLDNANRRVSSVFLGVVDGSLAGTSGTLDIDHFRSW